MGHPQGPQRSVEWGTRLLWAPAVLGLISGGVAQQYGSDNDEQQRPEQGEQVVQKAVRAKRGRQHDGGHYLQPGSGSLVEEAAQLGRGTHEMSK